MKAAPWVEKYRPKTINDVAHQEETVSALRSALETGKVPHLLFYGPPGTGKTSTILAMAHEMFGSHYSDRVLELNASDERGISVVRDKVKRFASTAVGKGTNETGKKLPPYKLIILDEADSMTGDAQSALRRTMELYTRVTRFCLICNYVSRIIEPLASRCAKFRFQPLSEESFKAKINQISEAENLQMGENAMSTLLDISKGDMRMGITLLQTSAQFDNGQILRDSILETAAVPSPDIMKMIWQAIKSLKFMRLKECADHLQAEGYALSSVVRMMQEDIIASQQFTDTQKANMLIAIAETDKAIEDGANEDLQFRSLISKCQEYISEPL